MRVPGDGSGRRTGRYVVAAAPAVPRPPSEGWPEPVEGVWRLAAPAVEESVPRMRHAVRDLLDAQGLRDRDTGGLVPALLLIVSELVTNAVRHAALLSPQLVVEVVIGSGWIRVSVEDSHPYRPTALQNDFGRTGGRGLLLVKTMALDAGGCCDVERTVSGGKVIWAALPLPDPLDGSGPGRETESGAAGAPAGVWSVHRRGW